MSGREEKGNRTSGREKDQEMDSRTPVREIDEKQENSRMSTREEKNSRTSTQEEEDRRTSGREEEKDSRTSVREEEKDSRTSGQEEATRTSGLYPLFKWNQHEPALEMWTLTNNSSEGFCTTLLFFKSSFIVDVLYRLYRQTQLF
jgi:hypothetical protein